MDDMTCLHQVALLEELNLNAWPSLRSVHYDGWLVRQSGGASRRVNSVNVVREGIYPTAQKIDYCEALFSSLGQRCVFRITPLCPPALDRELSERGYAAEGATSVRVSSKLRYQPHANVRLTGDATDEWVRHAAEVRGLTGREADIFTRQHSNIAVPSIWAAAKVDGRVAGIGVIALERGWGGLHGIYVSANFRRRGIARQLTESLCAAASDQGAAHVWLQVEHANLAASMLYEELGFRTLFDYHHRVK